MNTNKKNARPQDSVGAGQKVERELIIQNTTSDGNCNVKFDKSVNIGLVGKLTAKDLLAEAARSEKAMGNNGHGKPATAHKTIQENVTPENIAQYRLIFKGRQDVVPRYWKSKRGGGKTGYAPICVNQWDDALCNLKKKSRGGCSTCDNQELLPLSDQLIETHIFGGHILGVYPLLQDYTCHFITADFDRHKPEDPDPWDNVKCYLETCEVNEVPAYALRSKSGNGYHVYLFFSEVVSAWKARAMAFFLLGEAGVIGDDVELSSFDRLFPNQAKLSGKGLGNLISLPFQGSASMQGHTLFLNPSTDYKEPYLDQWELLRTLDRVTPAALDGLILEWNLKEEDPPARKGAKDFKPHVEAEAKGVFSRVRNGCKFMEHWCQDADKLTEPEWYAGLTIIARCKDGRWQAHKYSSGHAGYTELETDQKLEHALKDTGPYLCETIRRDINGKYCNNCSSRGKISTPLRLGEQTANDDLYINLVREMNKKHAVIQIGGKCSVLQEVTDPVFLRPDIALLSPQDLRNFYANKKIQDPDKPGKETTLAKYWFEHPDRREYAGLVFDPSKKAGPEYYNLWRGFAVEPKPGDWTLFKEFIYEIIADGKQSIGDWIIAWLARILQDPGGDRPGTAVVLRGGQGTGKGTFVNVFGQILGKHFLQIAQAGQITGRFNHHLKDVVLAFVDEGFWAGDKQAEGAIKNLITEPFITVEQKGKDIIRVKNNVNLIMASNNDWVIPAGLDERRFFVLDISESHKQDTAYFKPIRSQMANGGLEAMFHDLLSMDISGVDLRTFEQTAGLFEQKLFSMDTVQKYWFERLSEGAMRPISLGTHRYSKYAPDDWSGEINTVDQFNDYIAFAERLKDRYPLCEQQFGLSLSKMCSGITKRRMRLDGGCRAYFRIFPPLEQCRVEFCKLLKMDISWDDDQGSS